MEFPKDHNNANKKPSNPDKNKITQTPNYYNINTTLTTQLRL
jgi:hypothetical protein